MQLYCRRDPRAVTRNGLKRSADTHELGMIPFSCVTNDHLRMQHEPSRDTGTMQRNAHKLSLHSAHQELCAHKKCAHGSWPHNIGPCVHTHHARVWDVQCGYAHTRADELKLPPVAAPLLDEWRFASSFLAFKVVRITSLVAGLECFAKGLTPLGTCRHPCSGWRLGAARWWPATLVWRAGCARPIHSWCPAQRSSSC